MKRLFLDKRGALTVEASIVLPIFIWAVLSIAFIMRVAFIHNLVQHAITGTANELASYSYLYSVSGLQQGNDALTDTMNEKKKTFGDHLTESLDAYSSFTMNKDDIKNAAGQVIQGDLEEIDSIKNSIDGIKEDVNKFKAVFEDIKNGGAKKEFVSMAYFMASGGFEDLKGELASLVVKALIKKYISLEDVDTDKRLKDLNVINGFEGLDFHESTLFKDKKSIDIIVNYDIKPIFLSNILPDIHMKQRVVVKGWLDGEKLSPEASPSSAKENLWDMESDLTRGKEIQKREGRNLPDKFPVLTKFENGNAVVVKSINLDAPTYQKSSNVKARFRSFLKDLGDFEDGVYDDKEIKIKTKKLLIVVPEGTKASITDIIDEYTKLASEIKPIKIALEVKEGYGRSESSKDKGSQTAEPTPAPEASS